MRLTHPLNLPAPGRRQTLYVVFDFAESCVFDKQSLGPFHCDRHELRRRAPTPATAHLLPKLRCQIAEFLRKGSLKRLGILSPSTCVGLRYGLRFGSPSRFFLAAWSQWLCGPKASRSRLGVDGGADLPTPPAYTLQPALPIAGPPILLRHPWINSSRRYRNIDLFPIDYAFRPRLRDRLTLRGLPLLRKPWAYGVPVFHRHYRYSCQHTLFCVLQHPSRDTFTGKQNAPLPPFRYTE